MNIHEPQPASGQILLGDQRQELALRGNPNGRERTEKRYDTIPFPRIANRQLAGHERVIEQMAKSGKVFDTRNARSEVIDPDRGVYQDQ